MKNLPSINTLSKVFEDPAQARKILEMSREELFKLPACKEPAHYHGRWESKSRLDLKMMALNALESGLHGVEYVHFQNGMTATYLNVGDSYVATLIYYCDNFRVQSVGDFIEIQERRGFKVI